MKVTIPCQVNITVEVPDPVEYGAHIRDLYSAVYAAADRLGLSEFRHDTPADMADLTPGVFAAWIETPQGRNYGYRADIPDAPRIESGKATA